MKSKSNTKREETNMSDLVKYVSELVKREQTQQLQNKDTSAIDKHSGLNYQFMYKQLESAIEEILLEYPNDPVVNKLKEKVINNLKPILEMMLANPNQNPFDQN